ncbi:hypothetical protein BCR32DRAFT_279171 [Anaeromyces robustus]|uniref:Uncharacterized protein n=1 Tax=Anaeromyces robustus TaxID=1754192 RepID=A0A1Y1X8R6_9FUNG|nr:hypothetical protein BCR32DRAFT_279171 [Anaeromyces robustus]|eukprot:ORX82155.1 hypothetical protein BCR32DRAFT_279171 [Anaeromyces robustus]
MGIFVLSVRLNLVYIQYIQNLHSCWNVNADNTVRQPSRANTNSISDLLKWNRIDQFYFNSTCFKFKSSND